jgi:hypothetical protein
MLDYFLSKTFRRGIVQAHPDPGPMPGNAGGDGHLLFGLRLHREEKERYVQSREFDRGRSASLGDDEVSRCHVPVQFWHHAPFLNTLWRSDFRGIDTRTADKNQPKARQPGGNKGVRPTAEFEQAATDGRAADGADHKGSRAVPEFGPKLPLRRQHPKVKGQHIPKEDSMTFGVLPTPRKQDAEAPIRDVGRLPDEERCVVPAAGDAVLLRPDGVQPPGADPLEQTSPRDIHAPEVEQHDKGDVRHRAGSEDMSHDDLVGFITHEKVEAASANGAADDPGIVDPVDECAVHVRRKV